MLKKYYFFISKLANDIVKLEGPLDEHQTKMQVSLSAWKGGKKNLVILAILNSQSFKC